MEEPEFTRQQVLGENLNLEHFSEDFQALRNEDIISALESETRLLEGKMSITSSLQQRNSGDEISSIMRQLRLEQDEDVAIIYKFIQALEVITSKSQLQESSCFDANIIHAMEKPLLDVDLKYSEEASYLRLNADHECELRNISAARSKCVHSTNGVRIASLVAKCQNGALEVDSLLDFYMAAMAQQCNSSRRSFAPLFSEASRRIHSLAAEHPEQCCVTPAIGVGVVGDKFNTFGESYQNLSESLRVREIDDLDALMLRTRDLGHDVLVPKLARTARELQFSSTRNLSVSSELLDSTSPRRRLL